MTRELLTASRMSKLLDCPRAHFWSYECGLKAATNANALRFGSAWHRAMEARWKGAFFIDALAAAIADKDITDEFEIATISGLLRAYYEVWKDDPVIDVQPEIEFRDSIERSRTFDAAGKIDGIGRSRAGGHLVKVEHKTTGDSLADDSDYWLRLRANPQVLQYIIAAWNAGLDVREVCYDVTRKPSIGPLDFVPNLDEDGWKVVLDANRERVYKRDGTPKQTADKEKGETIYGGAETPEMFADRLYADAMERPAFYFARKEVPVLQSDVEEFIANRSQIARMILDYRADEKLIARRHHAWPRHLHGRVCASCEYKSFCLQNITPDLANPPAGFVVGGIHSELAAV